MDRNLIPYPFKQGFKNKKSTLKTNNKNNYPINYFKNKTCKVCSTNFTPYSPSEKYCSDKCKDEMAAESYLRRNYNIGIEDYRDIYEKQEGLCYICNEDGTRRSISTITGLVVDHNHTTGIVRGLLCHTCNSALGQFKDSKILLLKAQEYLDKPILTFRENNYIFSSIPKSGRASISMEEYIQIFEDKFNNDLNRKEIMQKYNLQESRVRGIIELKTVDARKQYQRFLDLKKFND